MSDEIKAGTVTLLCLICLVSVIAIIVLIPSAIIIALTAVILFIGMMLYEEFLEYFKSK